MSVISKLTAEQEKQIPLFIEKWIKQASVPMNHDRAIVYTRKLYKKMKQDEPLVIFGYSPMNTVLLCSLFFSLIKDKKSFSQLYSKLRSQLVSQLNSQLDSQLDSKLRSQLDSQFYSSLVSQLDKLHSQLNSQLDSKLRSQLISQLNSQLDSKLYNQLISQLHSQLKNINQNWYLGLWWLVWCGWYEYGKFIGVEFKEDGYDLFMNFNSEVHFIIPYKNIAFISEKPVEIKWKNKMLHNEDGLAVRYSDNYGLWCLNGVNVPQWLVETKNNNLDIQKFFEIKNAEVRREFIRKFGVERLKTFGTVKDKKDNYELIDMSKTLLSGNYAPYLLMKNPSIGTWHLEGVSPEVKTVTEALNWRNQTEEAPEILT